ncbi:MAG TPA: glycoside hydrolase family 43 protein [Croceibacterium sp.]|jgi:alpha-N-arabinofuranosidase
MREALAAAAAILALVSTPGSAAPAARFANLTYVAETIRVTPAGSYRNPILPGFQPDPSIVRVGADFYLVNSTFAWFPGIPVYHSRDLVHWRQIGNAIDRPGMLDFRGLGIERGVFAPAISWHDGTFYILNTCVDCGGNFLITARNPAGPWSNPVWLKFDGIDCSLFVDDDGTAWIVNNGEPPERPRYDGHRALWIQQFDLKTLKLFGPRKVLVDGGVHPQDKPVWAEGPHMFKRDGWYYLMAAEGGTAENHSETIYRSRRPDGPYVPGPVNPILTQRDLPSARPNRVEATGHAQLVHLPDGTWWGVFLATRPFAGQSTLLGRETWLLPVSWKDGWPLFLPADVPVPLVAKTPALPASRGSQWDRWTDDFIERALSPEWLRLRNPPPVRDYALHDGDLVLFPGHEPAGSLGTPTFYGRRLRHPTATISTTVRFAPEHPGDFAGLLAFMDEAHFLAFGVEGDHSVRTIVARLRTDPKQDQRGTIVASAPLTAAGPVELRIAIDRGRADLSWRAPGKAWHRLAADVDVEPLASVHAGLFTGLVIGPYALAGR